MVRAPGRQVTEPQPDSIERSKSCPCRYSMSCNSVIKVFFTVVEVMIPVIASMFCLLPGLSSISYMKFCMQTLSRMQSESMKRMNRLSLRFRYSV